jgi:glyoxylase-like metal-dependent hydrolase (beta-lactamase superfamily II)
MCELHAVKKLGRRTWLTRSASGLLALWYGLDFELGRRGWGVLLGASPRASVSAQPRGDGVVPIETTIEVDGQSLPVAAYLVVRGREIAVVDTLTPGNAARIGSAIQTAGLGWDAVRHVILTHYHPDHIGSAGDVTGLAPQAAVWAGAPDIPQIPLAREIRPAADGAEVFGLQIIATPGHTAGHISVLDRTASTLVVGDAAFNVGGMLIDLIPQFTADADQARESLRKLGRLGFERALFAHGAPIEQGAAAALGNLVAPAPAPVPAAPPVPAPQPAPAPAPVPAPAQVPRR